MFDTGRGIGEESRTFHFQTSSSGDPFYISTPRLVDMTWAAAGMKRESPWFHGRPRGVTFTMDVFLVWSECFKFLYIFLIPNN